MTLVSSASWQKRSSCRQFNSGCHQTTNVPVANSNFQSRMHVQSHDHQPTMKVDRYTMERHRRYRTYEERVLSFVSWPERYVPQTPEELSAAGFFYIGSADRVTCFHCGLTLRDWEAEHDPVTEHHRHSQECTFIKLHIAGLTEVTEVSSTTRPVERPDTCPENHPDTCPENHPDTCPESHPDTCPENHPDTCPENHPDTCPEESCESSHSAAAVPMATEHLHSSTCKIEQDFDKLVIKEGADENINKIGNPHSSREVESGSESMEVMDLLPTSCAGASDRMDSCLLGTSDDLIPMEQGTEKDLHFKIKSKGKSKRIKSLVAENRRLKEQSLCMICKTEKTCVLFLPCGHLVTCPDCAINTHNCVRCSRAVLGTVKTYMI